MALLAIGLLHMLLWPGEILTMYAVVGLLVLLPSTWLPRWAVAGLAGALILAALVGGGGPLLIAGLFLLGSALVRYGVVERIERSTWVPLLLGLAFAAGRPSLYGRRPAAGGPSFPSDLADLLIAGVVVCALLVLLRTPLRPVLRVVFAPLGRMALTNYLTATLLVLGAAHVLGLPIVQPHRWRSWRREPSWRPSGCSPPSGCAATAKGPWNGSGAGLRGLAARPPAPLGGEIRAAAALETPTDDILQVTLDQRVGIHGTTLSDLLVLWLLHRTSACLSQNCPPFMSDLSMINCHFCPSASGC